MLLAKPWTLLRPWTLKLPPGDDDPEDVPELEPPLQTPPLEL
jgi:hypothetical protein